MAFVWLKKLHSEELYSNVVHLGSFVMTILEHRDDFLKPLEQYQAIVYYADALYHTGEFKKSASVYMEALAFLKNRIPPSTPSSASKSRSVSSLSPSSLQSTDSTPENEVKYRLHLCLVKQKKLKEAVGVLDSIPKEARSPKVNAALAELHRKSNHFQQAKQCYADLIAIQPYAIDAAVELLQLGVPVAELLQISGMPDINQLATSLSAEEWLESWLVGHAMFAKRDYFSSAAMFRDLDAKTVLANNPRLLCRLANAYYSSGEYTKAISVFQRVHNLDPLYLDGMDILASLLAEDKTRTKELESLSTQLMSTHPESPAAWVAMGYLCKSMKKYLKALYFANKACENAQTTYVEGMLLKGCVLLESKKWAEAALHFREALQANPRRFELFEGLVNCHLEQHKMKEARLAAGYCVKQLGQNARTITLYASVLARDPSTIGEAQTVLERAVAVAPYLLKAVYLLVDIYDKGGNYDRAIDLLRRQTSTHVKNRLHRLLGDFLSKADRPSEALDSYRFALSLEPGDVQAEAGMCELGNRLGTDSRSLNSDFGASLLPADGVKTITTAQEPSPTNETASGPSSTVDLLHPPGMNDIVTPPVQASSYNHLANAPRRPAAGVSTTTAGTSSLSGSQRLVVSLDASAMTSITNHDGEASTPVDQTDDNGHVGDEIGNEEMLSADDSGQFDDGRSDVY